jgi:hypothetical protein
VALIDGKRREVFAACCARAAGAAVHDARAPEDERPSAPAGGSGLGTPAGIPDSLTVLIPPTVVPAAELLDFLAAWPGAVVGGDGAHLYRDRLPGSIHLARSVAAPTAVMALRAWRAGVPGVVEGLAATVPIYGRAPDAGRWTERQRAAAPAGRQRRGRADPAPVREAGA